jgi:hypothetical protein
MVSRNAHCHVVEIPVTAAGADGANLAEPRDLLPWADPYIARLLTKHRLMGALSDSLAYLNEAAGRDSDVDRDSDVNIDLKSIYRFQR